MKLYTVKYKHERAWFWHTIKRVKADAGDPEGHWKIIITEDECQYHFPIRTTVFKYSKDRFYSIKERMDEEAGQVVPIRREQ